MGPKIYNLNTVVNCRNRTVSGAILNRSFVFSSEYHDIFATLNMSSLHSSDTQPDLII